MTPQEQYNALLAEFGPVNTSQFYKTVKIKTDYKDVFLSLKPENMEETMETLKVVMGSPGFVKFV